ncbi:MAG: DUF3386 family protein [Nitrospiria bacterium]
MALYERKEEKTDIKDDPEAKALLRSAFEQTSRWKKDFPGFTADLCCNDNGTVYKGGVRLKSRKEMTITMELPDGKEDLKKWIENEVGMITAHRAWRTFEDADGRYPVTFGEKDQHPLGREILIHGDGMKSRYRIQDGRIQQISRSMGRMAFNINIEEAMTTKDDKSLTTQYVVFYFSPDGKLTDTDSFTDRPFEMDGQYLPGLRRVISTEDGKSVVRVLEFKNHQWAT